MPVSRILRLSLYSIQIPYVEIFLGYWTVILVLLVAISIFDLASVWIELRHKLVSKNDQLTPKRDLSDKLDLLDPTTDYENVENPYLPKIEL